MERILVYVLGNVPLDSSSLRRVIGKFESQPIASSPLNSRSLSSIEEENFTVVPLSESTARNCKPGHMHDTG